MSQNKTSEPHYDFRNDEIEAMAEVLCTRFGVIARGVAEFLAFEHERANDEIRRRAWAAVADYIASARPPYH